ncbi:IclR family transcriptional regulator [Actinomadura rugatobispora]|uniref:IclR family transcriptional regulator n=1 Tax=Actinomadura rugatobispora TaxID=1994 RepID=A0ABW0ZSJ7_9ACTN|nr:IclR family transcriptional regulator [Actinomadura rugatobispora]
MQVLNRALRVIKTLSTSQRGMTLQQLHEELEIPIGSMHRVLAALTEERYVTRSPTNRRYFLGPAAAELVGISTAARGTLVTPPAPVLRAARESGETVFLTELIGLQTVCCALVEGHHPLRLFVRVGQEMPLHAAASARSILAYLPGEMVDTIFRERDLTAFTAGTLRTPDQVKEHLAQVRARGYDVCENELDENVWAVAAPVFSSTAHVVSSVTLAAAGNRMRDPIQRTRATEIVLRTARALSEELGHTGGFPALEEAAASAEESAATEASAAGVPASRRPGEG